MRTSFEFPEWNKVKKVLDGSDIHKVLLSTNEYDENYGKKSKILEMYMAPSDWISRKVTMIELKNNFLVNE